MILRRPGRFRDDGDGGGLTSTSDGPRPMRDAGWDDDAIAEAFERRRFPIEEHLDAAAEEQVAFPRPIVPVRLRLLNLNEGDAAPGTITRSHELEDAFTGNDDGFREHGPLRPDHGAGECRGVRYVEFADPDDRVRYHVAR